MSRSRSAAGTPQRGISAYCKALVWTIVPAACAGLAYGFITDRFAMMDWFGDLRLGDLWYLPLFPLVVASVLGPLHYVGVLITRETRAYRPLADMLYSALIIAGGAWILLKGGQPVVLGAALGAVLGYAYWVFAGKPREPYMSSRAH